MRQHLLFPLLLIIVFGATDCSGQCYETVEIDSVEYEVPPQWCGKKLDSSIIAEPETLVRLPEELCFEDYRIYVTPETKAALIAMADAAKQDSLYFIVDSGFRSASFQKRIIKRRLEEGQSIERIFKVAAPPGYSQHETGCALDFSPSEARFAETPEYQWLTENAGEFGFVETYPDNPEDPHPWESWHFYFDATLLIGNSSADNTDRAK